MAASKTPSQRNSTSKKETAKTKKKEATANLDTNRRYGSTSASPARSHQQIDSAFVAYAALAGTCGALSGICGKIGVSATSKFLVFVVGIIVSNLSSSSSATTGTATAKTKTTMGAATGGDTVTQQNQVMVVQNTIEYTIRVAMMAANAFFTGQMWRYYLKALNLGPTPVAQAINTAANFAVSAFVGMMMFGEVVGVVWVVGAVITACGLVLLI